MIIVTALLLIVSITLVLDYVLLIKLSEDYCDEDRQEEDKEL